MIGQAQQMAGPAREAVLAGVKEAEERKARGEQGGAAPAGAAAGADGAAAVNPFGCVRISRAPAASHNPFRDAPLLSDTAAAPTIALYGAKKKIPV